MSHGVLRVVCRVRDFVDDYTAGAPANPGVASFAPWPPPTQCFGPRDSHAVFMDPLLRNIPAMSFSIWNCSTAAVAKPIQAVAISFAISMAFTTVPVSSDILSCRR